MYFKDIPGIRLYKKQIVQNVKNKKIPHAQLFLGNDGFTHLPLALAVASYLLCQNKTDGDSCGNCPSCIKTHKFVHPDIHFVFPVVKYKNIKRKDTTSANWLNEWRSMLSKNPFPSFSHWLLAMNVNNEQVNINGEECNKIIHNLSLKSWNSDYKILIIWLPEYLGKEGNRILKFLEEPPESTLIFMVSNNERMILKTILSRIQKTQINKIDTKALSEYFENKFNWPSGRANKVAHLSKGNISKAFDIANENITDFSNDIVEWFRECYLMDPLILNKKVNSIAIWGREKQKIFLEYLLNFLRELLYYVVTNKFPNYFSDEEKTMFERLKTVVNANKIERLSILITQSYNHISRNANTKILFMSISLEIGQILKA